MRPSGTRKLTIVLLLVTPGVSAAGNGTDESAWNWTMEFSRDGGNTWAEVYRIRATRSAD